MKTPFILYKGPVSHQHDSWSHTGMFTVCLNLWGRGEGLRMNLTQLLICPPQTATDRAWTVDIARGTACDWRRMALLTTARSAAALWSTPTSPPAPTMWIR